MTTQPFDEGEILINGISVAGDPLTCKMQTAYLPDNPDLYDYMTGGAIFFSTHVLEVAEKLCDKVAIIQAGKLVKCGTMNEVRGGDSLEDTFLELAERRVA